MDGDAPARDLLAARYRGRGGATETQEIGIKDARAYCSALLKSGHLKVVRKSVPGKREAMYRLIRNTGPQPPRERRVTGIWDENLGRYLYLPGVEL